MLIKTLIAIIAVLIGTILLATTTCLKAASRADKWKREIERRNI